MDKGFLGSRRQATSITSDNVSLSSLKKGPHVPVDGVYQLYRVAHQHVHGVASFVVTIPGFTWLMQRYYRLH